MLTKIDGCHNRTGAPAVHMQLLPSLRQIIPEFAENVLVLSQPLLGRQHSRRGHGHVGHGDVVSLCASIAGSAARAQATTSAAAAQTATPGPHSFHNRDYVEQLQLDSDNHCGPRNNGHRIWEISKGRNICHYNCHLMRDAERWAMGQLGSHSITMYRTQILSYS